MIESFMLIIFGGLITSIIIKKYYFKNTKLNLESENMEKYVEAIIKALAFSLMLTGAVVSGSGMISLLTEYIDTDVGFLIVGIVFTLPGTLILGYDRMNRIEIKGVKFTNDEGKNDEKDEYKINNWNGFFKHNFLIGRLFG
jgi:hypothetical protein